MFQGVGIRCLVHTRGRQAVLAGHPVDVHYIDVGDPRLSGRPRMT